MTDVLFDYTTLVSATNVLNCQAAEFPLSARSPYEQLLARAPTPPEAPLWLEVSSLADAVEAVVLHDRLVVSTLTANDRILDRGRYQAPAQSDVPMGSVWRDAGVLDDAPSGDGVNAEVQDWLKGAAEDETAVMRLADSMFDLLEQPAYRSLPDLFSHSQTVYKFDGETIWNVMQQHLPLRQFTRRFQRLMRERGVQPAADRPFYAAEILAFFVRGLLYNDMAKRLAIPYHPHPARAAIAMADGLWAQGVTSDYAEVPIQFLAQLRDDIAQATAHGLDLFELDIPPIFATVLAESQRPEDIPKIALQIRNSTGARHFREWAAEAYGSGKGLRAVDAQRQLESVSRTLRLELGLDRGTVGLNLWLFSFDLRLPRWVHKPIATVGRRHLQFLRELARTSLDVMSLERELIRLFAR